MVSGARGVGFPLQNILLKRSASPLTSGVLWTYTAGIGIVRIVGIVRTQIQAQATQTNLTIQNDALTLTDLCATANLTGATVGTLLHLKDNAASALDVHPAGTDGNTNALSAPILSICTTSGTISVVYGAASTGVIDWYLTWIPITPGATVAA